MTERVTKTVKTHTCYEFALSQDDFDAFMTAQERSLVPYDEWLAISLETSVSDETKGVPGVASVDYSRPFAPSLSILIEAAHDTEATHETIRRIISEKVDAAHAAINAARPDPES